MELRRLPKVDRVVETEELSRARRELGRRSLTRIARRVIAEGRERAKTGAAPPTEQEVSAQVAEEADRLLRTRLGRVINATGVLLHTNLGRAPLPDASLQRIAEVVAGYSNLELDMGLGRRTRRGAFAETVLADLVGAEAALIVNNNAAAVLLALSALAGRRQVVVSRGELVEIGGGFRIPEVLARSGAELVEVGTTNRTRVEDYARAISDRTGCVLRVHPSNFKISGFSERPALSKIAEVTRARGVPLVKDLGGGLIVDLPPSMTESGTSAAEPSVQRCLEAGADLVCFSLDKLFGGPQGGAIVGPGALVDRLRADPLSRALRVDKLTLAALEPVLHAYARAEPEAVVVHALLRAPVQQLAERVERWRLELGARARHTRLVVTEAAVGGGTLAEVPLRSAGLALEGRSADALSSALRRQSPPVLGRITDRALVLDARTVLPDEDQPLLEAVRSVVPV